MSNYYKSPLCYCGNKFDLLPQIIPLFPKNINNFVDLFCGGLDVSLNVNANKVYSNDIMFPLIDLYKCLQSTNNNEIIEHINAILQGGYGKDKDSFNALKVLYNNDKNPLNLFLLIKCSFSQLARFNAKKEYNQSFGTQLSKEKATSLVSFANEIKSKNIEFSTKNFVDFNFDQLTENDFLYCDPPYLITCGVYQDGKRGFEGWDETYEHKLYDKLDELNKRNVKFAISNVLTHKEMKNTILETFIKDNHFNEFHFSNKSKFKRDEVFVCNYEVEQQKELTLFDV